MSDLPSEIQHFRSSGDPGSLVAQIPYAEFMGFDVSVDDEGVLTTMRYADPLIGNPYIPALHGGTLGALLEFAASFSVMYESPTLVLPKTINLTVAYLRSGKPKDTFCRCQITKQGRRVVTVNAFAWQDDQDRPIASAALQFLIKTADESRQFTERLPEIQLDS